jgi:SAM-dependent methyltransferase
VLSRFLKTHLPAANVDGFDLAAASIENVPPELRNQGCFSSDLAGLRRDYELAVIANVLHHVVPRDRQAVIAEIAGRLVPGGRVVIFEHNPLNPLTQWSVKHCRFDDDAILLHPPEAGRYLAGAGLKKLRRDYVVFFPKFLSWLRPSEPMLAWFPAGAQYALVGEKL